jgi:hypothetical protein
MTTELLALGGPKHGEWFPWKGDMHDLRVPIIQPIVFNTEPTPITDVVTYRLDTLAFKEENGKVNKRHVYRYENVSGDEALPLLQQYLTEMFIRAGD